MLPKNEIDEDLQVVMDEINEDLDGEGLDGLPDEDDYPDADDEMENFYADFRGY